MVVVVVREFGRALVLISLNLAILLGAAIGYRLNPRTVYVWFLTELAVVVCFLAELNKVMWSLADVTV